MNKYYNNISILNNNWFFYQESKYKGSYKIIVDFLFEELNEKNGKDGDKILKFDGDVPFEKYMQKEWNAFFLKNAIHQLFYSKYSGTNEEIFNKIYDKILELSPKLKDYKRELEKSKCDIKEYFNTFKIYDIIKLYKKIIQ